MRTFLALALVGALASCGSLKNVYDTVTSVSVPRQTVAVAISSFDVAKATATNYIIYCTPNPKPAGCDVGFIRSKLVPAVKSGTEARKSLSTFLRENPNALGPVGTYNALVAATTVLKETPK